MIKNNGIGKNFTNGTVTGVTGSTGEFVLSSILIPANTFKSGDVISVDGLFESSGGTAIRIYVGSAATTPFSASTQVMVRSLFTEERIQTQRRTLHIVRANGDITGTSPDRGTIVTATGTGIFNEYRSGVASILSIDWTQDRYVFFTGTLGSDPANRYFNQYTMKIWTY
jgi:hypothetical protein